MKWCSYALGICFLLLFCGCQTPPSNTGDPTPFRQHSQVLVEGSYYSLRPASNIMVIPSFMDYPNGEYLQILDMEITISERGKADKRHKETRSSNIVTNDTEVVIQGNWLEEQGIGIRNSLLINKRTRRISGLKEGKAAEIFVKALMAPNPIPSIVSSGTRVQQVLDVQNGIRVQFSMEVQGIADIAGMPMLLWTGQSHKNLSDGRVLKYDLYWLHPVYNRFALGEGITKMTAVVSSGGTVLSEVVMRSSVNVFMKPQPTQQDKDEEEREKRKLFKTI